LTVIVAIVFVVVMLVGPIMMLKPTKTQKKQAKLRTLASQSGLMVAGGMTLPNGRFVPQYTQPFAVQSSKQSVKQRNKPLCFELRKQRFSHESHFSGIWDWVGEEPVLDDVTLTQLKCLAANANEDYFSLGTSNIGVFVMWNEALRGNTETEAIDNIVQFLNGLNLLFPKEE